MDRNNQNEVFANVEYCLIRLLLIGLLLIGAYKLLAREIYEAHDKTEVTNTSGAKRH